VLNLEQRAKMHAALGEPVRLAIIDHLVLGDVSPGDLGRVVDLPTNLLAHHLRVLDEAGLIRRIKSEGDKRRSYVQLVLDDPTVVAITRSTAAAPGSLGRSDQRVVFVCTQNSARSQLAAAAWSRASTLPVASAGTRPAARIHPRAISVGRRHGLKLAKARPAHLTDVVQPGDLLVAVCDNAFEELPPTEERVVHWAVPDPARIDTDQAFESAYEEITQRVQRLADAIRHEDSKRTR
jgi:protein-tyrosine-phosphatase